MASPPVCENDTPHRGDAKLSWIKFYYQLDQRTVIIAYNNAFSSKAIMVACCLASPGSETNVGSEPAF